MGGREDRDVEGYNQNGRKYGDDNIYFIYNIMIHEIS